MNTFWDFAGLISDDPGSWTIRHPNIQYPHWASNTCADCNNAIRDVLWKAIVFDNWTDPWDGKFLFTICWKNGSDSDRQITNPNELSSRQKMFPLMPMATHQLVHCIFKTEIN